MRRFIAIVFLLIYANVGLATAVNLHFCNGHISKVSLIKGGLHKICCCKTKSMTNSCCKDEVLLSKSDSHQVQTTTILPELNFKILTLPAMVLLDEVYYNQPIKEKLLAITKLRSSHTADICLSVCNLRI